MLPRPYLKTKKMNNGVFDRVLVDSIVDELKITDLGQATIGQVLLLASRLEQVTGIPFIRMDQGVPGLEANRIGVEAEKEALDRGVAAIYPPAEGIPPLKEESSRFIKAFLDIDVAPRSCVPVTGSVSGSFGSFIICNQLDPAKDTVLFLDPGFPIQKSQLRMLSIKYDTFDVHDYRGEALRDKLESHLAAGNVSSIIYSNPNNPAWICFDETELRIIGELATEYGAVVIEDLAYFAMDFRNDLGTPFRPPYQATVARYTDNYILLLSGSKIFSYAGQRIAVVAMSDKLYDQCYPALAGRYGGVGQFGPTLVNGVLYMITSGAAHSVEYALAEMFRAASDGRLDFVEDTKEYGRRAERMKRLFTDKGFRIVYDKDGERAIGDGFFFTLGYGDMTSAGLMRELIYYGISSITLNTTGSLQQGVRACTSRMTEELYPVLAERLDAFAADHPL